jgi:hypothetical protein
MITRRIFLSDLAGVTDAGWTRLALPQGVGTQNTHDLAEAFLHPPDSARPWVYWFWINGNVTREGITADLEAMQRVGIGGTLIMEVDPGVPAGDLQFGSQQWMDMFHFAADSMGLPHDHWIRRLCRTWPEGAPEHAGSHSSQGETVSRVLIDIDSDHVAKGLINSRMAYVAVSQAGHDAQSFTQRC